jgi:arabinogalactan oligomer/maltooligosaccharide transport system substrate-binding protein
VIWADTLKAASLQAPAAAWGAANGVTVAVQAVPGTLRDLVITADQAGNGPDIVIGAHDWLGTLVQNGSIVPVTIGNQADFPPSVLDAARDGGQIFGVPYSVETLVLFANTNLVPDHTAPATIEEMIEAGEASGAERVLCLPLGTVGDAYHLEPIFTAGGGYIFGRNADGSWNPQDVGVDGPGGLAAADRIAQLGADGILSTAVTGDNAIPLFADGRCAYLISGPWAIASLTEANTPYTMATIPGFAGGGEAAPFMGVNLFYQMAHGANPAFAQSFLQDLSSNPEITEGMFRTNQLPPAQISLLNQIAQQYPDMAKIAEAAQNATAMPAIPEMNAIWGPLGQAQASVVDGADPHATFTAAATAIRNAIAGG